MKSLKWEVEGRIKNQESGIKAENIIDVLLWNRGIKTEKEKKEFFNPKHPSRLSLKELKIDEKEIEKAISRIEKANSNKEKVVVYGDYDADGIVATAVIWEALYELGIDALPFIPDRFEEGYGLNEKGIDEILQRYPDTRLIITVDNGIVANKGVSYAKKKGIEVIITDHHQLGKENPGGVAVIHTTEISGSGVAWVLSRELDKKNGERRNDLAAVGSISDQIPLVGVNRSFVKYGILELRKTQRPGLLKLFEEAGISKEAISYYQIGFIVAPRINAMGRLRHGMDSLRLLCTRNLDRANELALVLSQTNRERQQVVEEVLSEAREMVSGDESVIVVVNESYHEGIIGLIASNLAEEFYRPTIVISKGEVYSKASARSISGFNIIENIRRVSEFILEGGGHPMAAGFTIETEKIELFREKLTQVSAPLLTEDVLTRKLRIDLEVGFDQIDWELLGEIEKFEPTGIGNPAPLFCSRGVEVTSAKTVGMEGKHLKLKLREGGREFDGIGFDLGNFYGDLSSDRQVDVVYSLERNEWNGEESLQLKVRDIKISQ